MTQSGIIISLTECTRDIRIYKMARSISEHGIDVSVLSCYADSSLPRYDKCDGFSIWRETPLGIHFTGLSKVNESKSEETYLHENRASISRELFGIINFIFFFVIQIRLFLLLISRKYDFIHTNDWETLLIGYLYSRFRKCIWIHDSHEIYAEQDPDFPNSFKKLVTFSECFLFKRSSHLITVNNSIAKHFSIIYMVKTPLVVFNCPSHQMCHSYRNKGNLRLVYVGVFEKNRGLEELIGAMECLDAELYLQGFGTLETVLRKKVIRSNLQSKVFFIDPVPVYDIVSSLSRYDIGILPFKPVCLNLYYVSPNKIFEYMMAGLAIVSVDLPELRSLITECKNGLLYKADDYRDLVRKVQILADDPILTNRMKCASQFNADRQYYWEKQVEKVLKLYS